MTHYSKFENNNRKRIKNIKLLPMTENADKVTFPVFKYYEHYDILEKMAKEALKVLE